MLTLFRDKTDFYSRIFKKSSKQQKLSVFGLNKGALNQIRTSAASQIPDSPFRTKKIFGMMYNATGEIQKGFVALKISYTKFKLSNADINNSK